MNIYVSTYIKSWVVMGVCTLSLYWGDNSQVDTFHDVKFAKTQPIFVELTDMYSEPHGF